MPLAYSYVRWSSARSTKGDSLRRQTTLFKEWLKRHPDHTPVDLKPDLALPAFKGQNRLRGALGEFLKQIKAGIIPKGSCLVCESLDRLSRQNIRQAQKLLEEILEAGVNIATCVPDRFLTAKSLEDPLVILEILFIQMRAHEEGLMKEQRLQEMWHGKRLRIHEKKLTSVCPAWLTLSEDRKSFIVDKQKAALVKRIYRLATEGYGITQIVRQFTEQKVPPIGKTKVWTRSYIALLLRTKAVLGEYQPHIHRSEEKRTQIGDPIPNYYPAILTEQEYYKARKALSGRRWATSRGDRITNLFTNLVWDVSPGHESSMVIHATTSQYCYLTNLRALEGRETRRSVNYWGFEMAFLEHLTEIKAADIMPNRAQRDTTQDNLDAEHGKLLTIKRKIAKIKDRIQQEEEFDSLVDVLKNLEREQKEIEKRIATLKQYLVSVEENSLNDTKELVTLLSQARGDERRDLRVRLKERIRGLIKRILLDLDNKEGLIVYQSGAARGIDWKKKSTHRKETDWHFDKKLTPKEIKRLTPSDIKKGVQMSIEIEV